MTIKEVIEEELSRYKDEVFITSTLTEEELNLDLVEHRWPPNTRWWGLKHVYWIEDPSGIWWVNFQPMTVLDRLHLEFIKRGDDFSNLASTLSNIELNSTWDGDQNLPPFTAWGTDYVYFKVTYDWTSLIGAAPRHPCDIITDLQHID